jgi:hypothetical protein
MMRRLVFACAASLAVVMPLSIGTSHVSGIEFGHTAKALEIVIDLGGDDDTSVAVDLGGDDDTSIAVDLPADEEEEDRPIEPAEKVESIPCEKARRVVVRAGYRDVRVKSCNGKSFRFMAYRTNHRVEVAVSRQGQILNP